MIDAARLEGNEREVRRLMPLVKRAKARWIKANRRVTRGGVVAAKLRIEERDLEAGGLN